MDVKRYKDDPKKECCYTCKFFLQPEGYETDAPNGVYYGSEEVHGFCWAEGPGEFEEGTYETACCKEWEASESKESILLQGPPGPETWVVTFN